MGRVHRTEVEAPPNQKAVEEIANYPVRGEESLRTDHINPKIKIIMNSTVRFVSRAFTALGQCLVQVCTSDLIIETPRTVEALDNGETVILMCRHNGADNIERFRDCLRESGKPEPTMQDAWEYCERTLGWEVYVELRPDQTIILEHNPRCTKLNRYAFQQLVYRFETYGLQPKVKE